MAMMMVFNHNTALDHEKKEDFQALSKKQKRERFRGLLCGRCNRVLGNPAHPTVPLEAAIDCLRKAKTGEDLLPGILQLRIVST